jgi:hypothetical protein
MESIILQAKQWVATGSGHLNDNSCMLQTEYL